LSVRSPERPLTQLEVERESIKVESKTLYLNGKSTTEISEVVGKSPSVIARYLKEQGVKMRKRWDRGHGIREDGKKQCPLCSIWKDATDQNFYWIKASKRLSSYCKPCDCATAIENSRKARKVRKDAADNRKRERMRHNAQSRLLLEEAANYIGATQSIDLDIVQEIKSHLSIGKKLFHDS